MMMILSMMIVMTMMIKQTDDHLKYDDEGKGVGDLKPLSIRIFDTLLSRVHLKLINEIIEGTMFGGAITMIMTMMMMMMMMMTLLETLAEDRFLVDHCGWSANTKDDHDN